MIPNSQRSQLSRLLIPALLLIVSTSAARAQTEDLLRYLPRSTNAIVVMDVASLLSSPMASEQGWKDKQSLTYGERPLILPPEASRVVVGAQLNAAEDLQVEWELGVLALTERFPVSAIARAEGGYVDTVHGAPAVWTPSDAYIIELAEQTLGVLYPANRQFVSRWVELSSKSTLVEISDYLQQAASQAGSETQLVMALDLGDAVQAHSIHEGLETSETLADHQDQVKPLAKLLMGLRGVTMTVQVTNEAKGKLRVDFTDPVAPLGKLAKPLLLEALANYDVFLDDYSSWNVELLDRSLIASGSLSESSLRRIGSILQVRSTKFSDLKDAAPAEAGSDDYVKASQVYFRSVNALIGDLKKTLTSTRDNHAVWMERYGSRIDAMPILNVDEALLEWGANVASTFRGMSVVERSANVRTGVRKSSVYTGYSYGSNYNGDWYGNTGNDATSTAKQKSSIKMAEQGQARISRFNSWKEVEDATSTIRRQMTDKYKAEF